MVAHGFCTHGLHGVLAAGQNHQRSSIIAVRYDRECIMLAVDGQVGRARRAASVGAARASQVWMQT
eukprot:347440-Chlamydomonas_euryale.AAC.1